MRSKVGLTWTGPAQAAPPAGPGPVGAGTLGAGTLGARAVGAGPVGAGPPGRAAPPAGVTQAGLTRALDALAIEDVAGLSDGELRDQLLTLLSAVNRLQAQVGRRVAAFDRRGISAVEACRGAPPRRAGLPVG
jgi:hypothetical protein